MNQTGLKRKPFEAVAQQTDICISRAAFAVENPGAAFTAEKRK